MCCSCGDFDSFALEDAVGAGSLVRELSDAGQ
jgi:hypothetical protein